MLRLPIFARVGMPRLSRSTSSLLGLGIVEIVTACAGSVADAVEIIEHRALKPRRIPSRSWRELIKNVWEVDPLLCPQCHHKMRIVSLINDAAIIKRILRHVGSGGVDQWVDEVCNHGVRIAPSTGPPVEKSVAVSGIFDRGQLVIEPWLDDPMPDDDCGL